MAILLEEPDEEKCTDALVSIGEGVILDHEIEEMCCLFLDRRIEIRSIIGRDDRREDPRKTLIFLIPEYIIRFSFCKEIIPELLDRRSSLGIIHDIGDILVSFAREIPGIITIQHDE